MTMQADSDLLSDVSRIIRSLKTPTIKGIDDAAGAEFKAAAKAVAEGKEPPSVAGLKTLGVWFRKRIAIATFALLALSDFDKPQGKLAKKRLIGLELPKPKRIRELEDQLKAGVLTPPRQEELDRLRAEYEESVKTFLRTSVHEQNLDYLRRVVKDPQALKDLDRWEQNHQRTLQLAGKLTPGKRGRKAAGRAILPNIKPDEDLLGGLDFTL